jgi:hypothetical protein
MKVLKIALRMLWLARSRRPAPRPPAPRRIYLAPY